jgi:hypothetical protein
LAVAAILASTAAVRAQDGIVEAFCEGGDNCIDDTLEIVIDGAADGFQVDGPHEIILADGQDSLMALVVSQTVSENVQGWSYGVSFDPAFLVLGDHGCAVPGDDYLCGTDAQAARVPPSFNVSTAVDACPPDGPSGFISAVVLSFIAQAALPVGRNSLAFLPLTVVAVPPPEGTVIRVEDNGLCNAPSPPVAINITVGGTAQLPASLTHGIVRGPCVESPEGPFGDATCEDGIDNDCDKLIDAADPDCADGPCVPSPEGPFGDATCADDIDNDCDMLVDAADPDCDEPVDPGDYGFAYGVNGDGNTVITMTNELNALAFQLGVSTDGGNLSFASDLGTDNTRLVELLITDVNGDSHEGGGLDIGADRAFADDVTSLTRGAAIAAFSDGDFFAFDLNPGVGGPGFTVGYVSDLDAATNQIPNTAAGGSNEVLVINGGEEPEENFSRGDADGNGKINISDAVNIIQIVLGNVAIRYNCRDALDANDDGMVNITDAIPVLGWIFMRGDRLPEPFLACGLDTTDDALTCEEASAACAP